MSERTLKAILTIIVLSLHELMAEHAQLHGAKVRHKRSIGNFKRMVEVVTGRHAVDFLSYGNYCGMGGGGIPRDPIDGCCYQHDMCYGHALRGVCAMHGSSTRRFYFLSYHWKPTFFGPFCDDMDPCRRAKCRCDTRCSHCFGHNGQHYNRSNKSLLGRIFGAVMRLFG